MEYYATIKKNIYPETPALGQAQLTPDSLKVSQSHSSGAGAALHRAPAQEPGLVERTTSSAEPREDTSLPLAAFAAHPGRWLLSRIRTVFRGFLFLQTSPPPPAQCLLAALSSDTSRGTGVKEQFRPDTWMALEKP